MTSPAITLTPAAGVRNAARLLDESGVKQLPIVDTLGRLAGIVTRSDLLKEYLRSDDMVHADVRAAPQQKGGAGAPLNRYPVAL